MKHECQRAATTAMCAFLFAGVVLAQSYPTKTVRIIVPHPAGGPVDVPPRGAAPLLAQIFGQPFVIENRDGADGIIGAEACAKAAPDGHTLCTTASSVITTNPLVRSNLPYDPPRDFAPIIHMGALNSAFLVNPRVPANSLLELIDLARAKPGTLTFATLGATSVGPIFIGWAKAVEKAEFYQIPFKSTIQGLQAAVAGEVNIASYSAGATATLAKAGKIRPLAVIGANRSKFLPDVPTLKEAGVDLTFRAWVGMFAPVATPREIVRRLNAEIAKLYADPAFIEKFVASQGLEVDEITARAPELFAEMMRADREIVARMVAVAGIPRQ
ncbi:MAG: Bug family tripartite tricarboxylate transporter substrate binding protein [Burkholderiales bacterium]